VSASTITNNASDIDLSAEDNSTIESIAGTIMGGLLVQELKIRGLIRRTFILAPANLCVP
jgi:hypothetical protein